MTDPASDDLCAEMSKVATEDEKNHRFFSFVTSTYWLEALAANCCARFDLDTNRTAGLSEIQLARQRELEPVRRQWRIASGIIAAAGFIATQVPQETFAAFGFSNDAYGYYRFWVVVAVVLLLAADYLPRAVPLADDNRELRRRRTANAATGALLTYCAIRCSSD